MMTITALRSQTLLSCAEKYSAGSSFDGRDIVEYRTTVPRISHERDEDGGKGAYASRSTW
jgi:hypothetical protein